ncbi:MAG: hypothetical protein QOE65_2897 [Solirubrobacteraceae bacterium]|nr:hypothetical protein [Solirubrobacteraceae bacterium]
MQPIEGAGVKPLVSVVTTLTVPRRRVLHCLRSWTENQRVDGDVELVVAVGDGRGRLGRRVRDALRPGDRVLRVHGANEMAQYDAAARAARGEWLLFTEPHVEALPGCVAELLDHVRAHGLAGACVHTLAQPEHSRAARMEARMFQSEAAEWTRDGDWRKFTKRGLLVSRAAYLDAGGLDGALGRFAETALARALHERGHRLGYAPGARVQHQNSTDLGELVTYVWDYRRQAAAGDGAALRMAAAGRDGAPVERAVLDDALRVALARRGEPGWRALAGRLAALRVALALGPRAGRALGAWAPARRAAGAWLRFHHPLGDDERTYAAYRELWQTVGDLAAATRREGAGPWGLHEPESLDGTPFRWSDAVARLDVDGPGPVAIDHLGVRPVSPADVLVYRGASRLEPVAGECTPTRLVFDGAGDATGPVTLVCPPLPTGDGPERRTLGLPIVAVSRG